MRSTWVALGITFALVGCTTDSQQQLPKVSELQQGVTLLDTDDARGVVAAPAKIKSTPLPTTSDQAYWNGAGWFYPLGRLYSKCVALCVGHHSAVSNWQWPNGGSAYQIVENYCNHGTCAGNMGWECD